MEKTDPPFIGADGLEYWHGKPVESYRNQMIQNIRATMPPEYAERHITDYIIYHDGQDTRPDPS